MSSPKNDNQVENKKVVLKATPFFINAVAKHAQHLDILFYYEALEDV